MINKGLINVINIKTINLSCMTLKLFDSVEVQSQQVEEFHSFAPPCESRVTQALAAPLMLLEDCPLA